VCCLTNSRASAIDFFADQWDWVLCSYEYAANRSKDHKEFEQFVESSLPQTMQEALALPEKDSHPGILKRPTAPLHTDAYRFMGRDIVCRIFDEGQKIKNIDTLTHRSLAAIHAKYTFILSGTPRQDKTTSTR
jgi:SNF2 family DNA or RNA helicase